MTDRFRDGDPQPAVVPMRIVLERAERTAIEAALNASDGSLSAAARLVEVHRSQLQRKMRALGMR